MLIRRLAPKDAPELVALVKRCYGDSYGPSFFYDAATLAEMITKRQLCSVVASKDQRIIGHIGLTTHHTESIVCETGNTMIDLDCRGQGLLLKLGTALHALVLEEGYVGYIHYPTTAHDIMQHASVAFGGIETGIMLAYVPESIGPEHTRPLAATVVFQPLSKTTNKQVILPTKYLTIIQRIYKKLKLDRTIISEPFTRAETTDNTITTDYCPKRKVLHLFTKKADQALITNLLTLIQKHKPEVIHIDLPLDNPNINSVIEDLNTIGFFFCALLPEFAHTDLIRLQAITSLESDDLVLNLINEDAIFLGHFISQSASNVMLSP